MFEINGLNNGIVLFVRIKTPEELEAEEKLVTDKKMYMFAVAYSANIGGTGVRFAKRNFANIVFRSQKFNSCDFCKV